MLDGLPARESEPPARPQVLPDVDERGLGLVEEHDTELAHDHVKIAAVDAIDLHIRLLKGQPGGPCRPLRGERQQRPGNVGAHDPAAGLDPVPYRHGCPATPAADVEHPLAGLQSERIEEQRRHAVGQHFPLRPGLRPPIVIPAGSLGGVRLHDFTILARHPGEPGPVHDRTATAVSEFPLDTFGKN